MQLYWRCKLWTKLQFPLESRVKKIGSWSCQLWYHHPSWVLTLLAKRDLVFAGRLPIFSRSFELLYIETKFSLDTFWFSANHLTSSTFEAKQEGGTLIWVHTVILCGCRLFRQKDIDIFAWHLCTPDCFISFYLVRYLWHKYCSWLFHIFQCHWHIHVFLYV